MLAHKELYEDLKDQFNSIVSNNLDVKLTPEYNSILDIFEPNLKVSCDHLYEDQIKLLLIETNKHLDILIPTYPDFEKVHSRADKWINAIGG